MRARALAAAGLAAVMAAGCTHRSLTRNTVQATSTITDIQYRAVLANLAHLSAHPAALPDHVNLADGVVQINDRAGFGQGGGLTTFGGSDFGIEQFGPSVQRQVTEQWGTDATLDPERLTELQALYRAALGLPPLPPPSAYTYLQRAGGDGKSSGKSGGGCSSGGSGGGSSGTTSAGGGGSTPSGGGSSDSSDGGGGRRVPLDVLLSDVPPPG